MKIFPGCFILEKSHIFLNIVNDIFTMQDSFIDIKENIKCCKSVESDFEMHEMTLCTECLKNSKSKKIKHYIENLNLDFIKGSIKNSLKNDTNVTVFYGCSTRDNKAITSKVDDFFENSEFNYIPLKENPFCCGFKTSQASENSGMILREKLLDYINIKNIDLVISICPYCSYYLDFDRDFNIVSLNFIEFLGYLLDSKYFSAAYYKHLIKKDIF